MRAGLSWAVLEPFAPLMRAELFPPPPPPLPPAPEVEKEKEAVVAEREQELEEAQVGEGTERLPAGGQAAAQEDLTIAPASPAAVSAPAAEPGTPPSPTNRGRGHAHPATFTPGSAS